MIHLDQDNPKSVEQALAQRMRTLRKSKGFTQEQLAKKAGMSLSTYKRLEQSGKGTIDSLVHVAFVLGCQDDFATLFARKGYASIQEVINEHR